MTYQKPKLQALTFDPAAPPDPRPLGEPVLSARDVLAIVFSAFEQVDAEDAQVSAIKLEVRESVGEGRTGLAVYRAILGAVRLSDQ